MKNAHNGSCCMLWLLLLSLVIHTASAMNCQFVSTDGIEYNGIQKLLEEKPNSASSSKELEIAIEDGENLLRVHLCGIVNEQMCASKEGSICLYTYKSTEKTDSTMIRSGSSANQPTTEEILQLIGVLGRVHDNSNRNVLKSSKSSASSWNDPVLSMLVPSNPNSGLLIDYKTNGIAFHPPSVPSTSNILVSSNIRVELPCIQPDQTTEEPYFEYNRGYSQIRVVWPTKLSCPSTATTTETGTQVYPKHVSDSNPVDQHRRSFLSIFISLLLFLIVVYFCIGCIFKRVVLGASGLEACPHSEYLEEAPAKCVLCTERCCTSIATAAPILGSCIRSITGWLFPIAGGTRYTYAPL